MQRAKELLRSAANRAPLASLHASWQGEDPDQLLTDEGNSAGARGEREKAKEGVVLGEGSASSVTKNQKKRQKKTEVLQGPDLPTSVPAPASLNAALLVPAATEVHNEAFSFTTKKDYLAVSVNQLSSPSPSLATTPPPPTPTTVIEGEGDVGKNSQSIRSAEKPNLKKSKKEKALVVMSGYELERALRSCEKDDVALEALLATLRPAHVRELFANLAEPDPIARLLAAVGRIHGAHNQQWLLVLEWFEAVSGGGVRSFSLVSKLFEHHHLQALRAVLAQVPLELDERAKIQRALYNF